MEMDDAQGEPFRECIRNQAAMAVPWVSLQAQNAHLVSGAYKVAQFLEIHLCLRGLEVLPKDLPHLLVPPFTCRSTPLGRWTETWQMQVADPRLLQVRRKTCLGKARSARASRSPHVNQHLDTGITQGIEKALNR